MEVVPFAPSVITGVSVLILICNVLGNALVIIVIHRNKKLRNANTFLLLNLAYSDLMFAILIFTYTILLSYGIVQLSLADCLSHALTSIYTLVAIAVERYFAILKPFVHLTRAVKSLLYKVVFGIWILAVGLSTPEYFLATQNPKDTGQNITTNGTRVATVWFETPSTIYSYLLFVFGLIFPTAILVFCYSRVIYHVWFNADANKDTNAALLKSRRKLTKLFILVTVVFIITWAPTFVRLIVTRYIVDAKNARNFEIFSLLLGLVGSTANPIIYSFRCPRFRQEIVKLLNCRRCKEKRRPNVSSFFMANSYSLNHMERKAKIAVEPVLISIPN